MTLALAADHRVAFPLRVLPDGSPESVAHSVRYSLTTRRGTHLPDPGLGLPFEAWDTTGATAAQRAQVVRLAVAATRGVLEVGEATADHVGNSLTIAASFRVAGIDGAATLSGAAVLPYADHGPPAWYVVAGPLSRGVIVGG